MIYYVGDLHGRVDEMMAIDREAMKNNVKVVIQVGDFGIRWPGSTCSMWKYFEKRSRKMSSHRAPIWITCGGNHDNWDKWLALSEKQGNPDLVEIAPGCFYARRGTVHNIEGIKHLFIGGAESTDRHYRIEGQSWWSYETPTHSEFNLTFSNLEEHKPQVVVSHDSPTSVPIYRDGRHQNATPVTLDRIFNISSHKPERWYFGHHHLLESWQIDSTEFICCGSDGEYQVYNHQPEQLEL